MVRQEGNVVRIDLEYAFRDAGKQGEVAADVRLNVQARDLAAEEQTSPVAGHAKTLESKLDDWIDDDHTAAAPANFEQRAHQPGMVAGGVRADQKDEVRAMEIVQRNRCRARADRAGQ